MNIAVLIAGLLSLLAFGAHAFLGDKEYQALKPALESEEKLKETWIQVRGGWHWVSVDLFFFGILLVLMAVTDIIQAKKEVLLLVSLYFLIGGVVWLGTVLLSKNNNKQILILGQWIFCFIMSGLIFWGSTLDS